MESRDVVIVGGGIAGGALAAVLAASGTSVLLLERQLEYGDHVRGEILWPWGVRAARALALEKVFLDAGANVVPFFDIYDEGADEPVRIDIGASLSGIEGSLNIGHPRACSALAEAAVAAGADVRSAIRNVRLTTGKPPEVRWTDSDGGHAVRCELVVGADGRRSSIRSQAGIGLTVDPPAHLVAGMLVDEVEGLDQSVNVAAREKDLFFYSFPQMDGRSRLYFCFPTAQALRFAGAEGSRRFLDTCRLGCLEGVAAWSTGQVAGPCATFPGEDSRADSALGEGVALIGDAAGYENPLQGQGLSMALQDVYDLSEALRVGGGPGADLTAYAERRAVRKRLADVGTILEVWINEGCVAQDPAERAARNEFIEGDEVLLALARCFRTGFDSLPQDLTEADLSDRLAHYG